MTFLQLMEIAEEMRDFESWSGQLFLEKRAILLRINRRPPQLRDAEARRQCELCARRLGIEEARNWPSGGGRGTHNETYFPEGFLANFPAAQP